MDFGCWRIEAWLKVWVLEMLIKGKEETEINLK